MRIGQAARGSGLEPSAIRFYESAGVLPEARRTSSGYRDYTESDVEMLRLARRLRALELPLRDIQGIVGMSARGEAPCQPVRAAIDREAAAIDARIGDLRRLREELAQLQAASADLVDDWPNACICHVLDDQDSNPL